MITRFLVGLSKMTIGLKRIHLQLQSSRLVFPKHQHT